MLINIVEGGGEGIIVCFLSLLLRFFEVFFVFVIVGYVVFVIWLFYFVCIEVGDLCF